MGHLLFESLAYAIGFALYQRDRRLYGDKLPDPHRSSVIVAAILGAAIGSKLLAWAEDPYDFARNWHDWQYVMGGKTIVGGLLGGTLAVEWMKVRMGVTRRTGDLFAIPLAVGIAIGRVGCWIAGLADHTYGSPTALPWGIDLGDGVRRHPVQLYEILFLGGVALLLARMRAVGIRRGGDLYRAFLIAYLGWRLCIDFLKPEPAFAGLSAIQWTCVAALAWYARDAAVLLRGGEVAHG
jgi:phosphatidylglycerol---prolipoprotein diacylglyceryl transferase